MNIAPPQPLTLLRRMSPSRFYATTQCALREVWRSSGHSAPLPKGAGAWLGQAIHSLLERAGKHEIADAAAIDSNWDFVVAETEKLMQASAVTRHLIPLAKTAPHFEIRRRQAFRLAAEMISRRRGTTAQASSELWLQTQDGFIGGKVDRVVAGTDGATISDFKSGAVLEDSPAGEAEVKEEYRLQLLLYAALYMGSTGAYPKRLQIIGLNGEPIPVPFTMDECDRALDNARRTFVRINDIVSSGKTPSQKQEDLASPSAKACRYCEFRPSCGPYLSQPLPRAGSADWPLDVAGTLAEKKLLGNGRVWLRILAPNGDQRIVRGLDPGRHEALRDSPAGVGVFSLAKDSVPNSYLETPTTTVFAQ